MTPKDVADIANGYADGGRWKEAEEFIFSASARELQSLIHMIQASQNSRVFHLARTALEIRLAEDAGKTAEKLSNQTDRLVAETVTLKKFTKGILGLTVALVFFTTVQIVLALIEHFSKTK